MSAVGKCTKCGGEAIGDLCSFCAGRRRPEYSLLTGEEFHDRITKAIQATAKLVKPVQDLTKGPGEAIFAMLFLCVSIIETQPELPPLEWYLARLLEMPKPEPKDWCD